MAVDTTIVNKAEWFMKPGKHQRSKHRCQDLGWKVHDRAKSFVLRPYTMHELRNTELTTIVFLHGQCQKSEQTKTYNKELCRVS